MKYIYLELSNLIGQFELVPHKFIQRASEASEADSQSCSIEISDIYIYIGMYAYVKISPALLITYVR